METTKRIITFQNLNVGLFLLLLVSISSCQKEETEYENPYPAPDNSLIINEELLGSEGKKSWYFNSHNSQEDGFYAIGEIDGSQSSTSISVGQGQFQDYYETVLVKFDSEGNKIWEKRPGFSCRTLTLFRNPDWSSGELIILVGNDSNEADRGRTRVMLFDKEGTFLNSIQIDEVSYFYEVIILAKGSDFVQFAAVGSILVDGEYFPYVQVFRINNEFEFSIAEQFKMPEPNKSFANIEVVNGSLILSGTDVVSNNSSDRTEVFVNAYNLNFQSLWGYTIKGEIAGDEIWHRWKQLYSDENRIYMLVAGEDRNKEETNDGSFWFSMTVFAFDVDTGNLEWDKKYSVSNYNDIGLNLLGIENDLLISGFSAAHISNSSDVSRSNGMSVRLGKNGKLISSREFGLSTENTILENCNVTGEKAIFTGYKDFDDGTSRAYKMSVYTEDL